MFTDLPKLLGKAFAVGFYLPATVLLSGLLLVLRAFKLVDTDLAFIPTDFLGVAVSIFAAWLVAILMMALNRPIVRTLEGYGTGNPLKLMQPAVNRHFDKNVEPLFSKAREIKKARAEKRPEPKTAPDFSKKLRLAVEGYPTQKEWLLPTKFGNRMRAFEIYSYEVYGLDAIPAWPRLIMILPESARNQLQEARSLLDFSVSLVASALIILVTYGCLALHSNSTPAFWIPIAAVALWWTGQILILRAADQWGEQVKSAIDLYRRDLSKQLDLQHPEKATEERRMWSLTNRMMIYRNSDAWDMLDEFRIKEKQSEEAERAADPQPDPVEAAPHSSFLRRLREALGLTPRS